MIIEKKSPLSGKHNSMNLNITDDQIRRWKGGELIQNVMPHLTANEREFLISGLMPDEWLFMYGTEDL